MYSDPVEATYYEERLQRTLAMAAQSTNAGAVLSHLGLAACYRAKLLSLLRVEAPSKAPLSFGVFRDSQPCPRLRLAC